MPRDLSDVLHYFFEEAETQRRDRGDAPSTDPTRGRSSAAQPLPVVAVPLGERDVVRAALLWNLAVEIARGGGRASVVAPAGAETEALWPEPGRGPLGAELVLCFADGVGDLARAAEDVAYAAGAGSREGGVVLARVPPDWLGKAGDAASLFAWTLLLCGTASQELVATFGQVRRLLDAVPRARVGITIHAPRSLADARRAFDRLDLAAQRHLGRPLFSYGLLLDDVHVYRAIVSRRPVGLTHPHSCAARALKDVARLLRGDAGAARRG